MNKSDWKALVSRTPSRWLGRKLAPASANRRRFWRLENPGIGCIQAYSLKMISPPRATFTPTRQLCYNASSSEFVSD
jgi:hypothetical protein